MEIRRQEYKARERRHSEKIYLVKSSSDDESTMNCDIKEFREKEKQLQEKEVACQVSFLSVL